MPMVLFACVTLLVATTLIHYEVLGLMNRHLSRAPVRPRARLVIVIFVAFLAHTLEILLYAAMLYLLARFGKLGHLGNPGRFSFDVSLYFSAETYTSLGYGDVVPKGDLRLMAGVEALNGLLLIGWSASYTYIAMERFWGEGGKKIFRA